MKDTWIQTVKGPVSIDDLGLILPHEHLFTDLRGPLASDYAQGDPSQVVQVMKPYLAAAEAAGVTAIVECSTVGVGRNIIVLQHLAETTNIHIVVPTGIYRDAYIKPSLRIASAEELAEVWFGELTEGIEGSNVKAGFIKIALSDDGPTKLELRSLQAAALASDRTGAAVASHTIGGLLARQVMDVLEAHGLDLRHFVWVHANAEPDPAFHLEAAERGAYIEFDAIGADWQPQLELVEFTVNLVKAGFVNRLLLSHDAGWYDPSQPDGQPEGSGIRGYTTLVDDFLPALRARGISKEHIRRITVNNPFLAFAMADSGS